MRKMKNKKNISAVLNLMGLIPSGHTIIQVPILEDMLGTLYFIHTELSKKKLTGRNSDLFNKKINQIIEECEKNPPQLIVKGVASYGEQNKRTSRKTVQA